MFKSYLKATLRNLWKNKTYSFLNIFGLAIGIVCAGVIFLWVEDEVNFDSTHVKKDRLYALRANWDYDGDIRTFGSTPIPAGPAIKEEIPGIANTCRVTDFSPSLLFNIGEKAVYASGRYGDPSLFDMFTLPFAEGNAATAFKDLHNMVVTQKTAKKFFGDDKNIVGRRVKVDNQQEYVITGVLKDLPDNSTLRFEWLAPFQIYSQQNGSATSWLSNAPFTYVELEPNADPEAINKKLYDFIHQKDPKAINHLFLLSMKDWRLRSNFENGKQVGGRITYVRMFSLIAWIILFIACINFMNLATARSEKRAREVGVRKVMGAGKRGLVVQFISEAILMAMFSCVLAVLIIWMILPMANALMVKSLVLGLQQPVHIMALVVITLICGLVAGSYPSLYLSSFNPVLVLKGLKAKTGGAAFIRKGLVVLQFSISIMLIICTVIIYQQIQHVKSRELGFKKEHLLSIDLKANMLNNFNAIRQDLLNTGMVEDVALSDHPTIYGGNNTNSLTWQGKPENNDVLISTRLAGSGFISTMGMQMLEGREFEASKGDSQNVIITSSLAKMMGKGSALGKKIEAPGNNGQPLSFTVIGVVKDYVYGDMYNKPDPVLFYSGIQYANIMYLRLKATADPVKAIAGIEKVITKANPGYPFDYTFVDDQFNEMFMSEMLVNRLSRVFAVLAIIISCLGLFGLAAYTAERRTKEIGIRKVLGASVAGITSLLSKDFLQLVIISCVVAFPLAWWAMSTWLQQYAYRVAIHWWVFLLAGIAAMMISLITISFQSVKAALANPVKSLKAE